MADWCESAGRVPTPATPDGTGGPAFELTTRWLRGRIIERLRALEADAWTQLPASIGTHGPADVEAAVGALQREGMLERRPDGAVRLPSG